MSNDEIKANRFFLKDTIRKHVDFRYTDQSRGIPPPPPQKRHDPDALTIELPGVSSFSDDFPLGLVRAIADRQSVRAYGAEPLGIEELSFLLWATQGLRESYHSAAALRTVPSAGARHAFETYLYVRGVGGLDEGIYRYLPFEHRLLLEFAERGLAGRVSGACFGQRFVGAAAVTFFWAAIPARMEWRYGLAAHKVIAIDAGHVCQNLYLACEAINAGTCAIAAYDQESLDALLRLDGEDEFVVYLAPVGKKRVR
ncbi:MAG: SagB/ThcOx family dehydrogenase [Spirochaetes bacterium]|jgi:SagB-type dehydrogenase family enzyme|nr:SagB/ThcOx family dehydrogenase [Spirochaetota bacterium]